MDRRPKLNPSQFALPGMEKLSHPGAPYLPQGITFDMQRETVTRRGQTSDDYTLGAYTPGQRKDYDTPTAELRWAGSKDSMAKYPGEIDWVENTPDNEWTGKRKVPGLANALHGMATKYDLGQETVPVHSPNLSESGAKWAKKVGGPGAEWASMSEAARDDAWVTGKGSYEPPRGTHPFEEKQMKVEEALIRSRIQTKGQQRLF